MRNFAIRFVSRLASHPKQKRGIHHQGGFFNGADISALLVFLVEAAKDSSTPAEIGEATSIGQLFPHMPSAWNEFHRFQSHLVISDLVTTEFSVFIMIGI